MKVQENTMRELSAHELDMVGGGAGAPSGSSFQVSTTPQSSSITASSVSAGESTGGASGGGSSGGGGVSGLLSDLGL